MKRFLIFVLFLLITLAIFMVGYHSCYNIKSVHECKNNIVENAESKRTISKELYCITKDAVEFKIEIIHNVNLNNPYQMYTDIQKYFTDIEYKDLKDGLIRLYQHLINIYKDDAYNVHSIHLYEPDNRTYIKFKYV